MNTEVELNYNLENSRDMRVNGTACNGWEEEKEERDNI